MLNTTQLTAIRSAQTATMDKTCQVKRTTYTSDGAGGQSESEANYGSQTVCRVAEMTVQPQERALADMLKGVMGYIVTMPYGTSVTAQDVLLVAGTRRFEILGIISRSWETAVRALCKELT